MRSLPLTLYQLLIKGLHYIFSAERYQFGNTALTNRSEVLIDWEGSTLSLDLYSVAKQVYEYVSAQLL